MATLKSSLLEKLIDEEYVKSLSQRKYRELMFCKELLSEEELRQYSSISVAYAVARERFVDQILPHIDEDLAFLAKHKHFNTVQAYYIHRDQVREIMSKLELKV